MLKKIMNLLEILKNRKIIFYFFTVGVIVLFLSCEKQKEIYYSFQELGNSKWSKNDTLYFDIDSSVIILNTPLDIELCTVNDSDYPYQNIWLYLQDDFSNKRGEKREIQYNLADEMGRWYGSGFGSLYQLNLKYKAHVVFTEKRNYKLKVVHGMRDESLSGIDKIGLKISPSE